MKRNHISSKKQLVRAENKHHETHYGKHDFSLNAADDETEKRVAPAVWTAKVKNEDRVMRDARGEYCLLRLLHLLHEVLRSRKSFYFSLQS